MENWNKAEEQKRRDTFWEGIDETQKAEFILGEGIYHSPVYGRHWMASTHICRYLIPYVYDQGLGMLAYEKAMVRMTRNDYEPDICFWRKELAATFEATQSTFPPPHFIIEILSDSTEARDRGVKFQDYALHGVEEYWIIDPRNNSIEQYLLSENQVYELALKLKTGKLASTVIKGFELDLSLIFEADTPT